jgi:hypothetical protein
MIAICMCVLAFLACLLAGRRSLGLGLILLFTFGYFYGIVRANLLTTFSHFIFDAGVIGLYCSQSWLSSGSVERNRLALITGWMVVLIGWPMLLVLLPFQTLLVSLVGLRGNTFFIPLLVLGARLRTKDLLLLSYGLAALNLGAVGFGALEYFTTVTRFYPVSPVTALIYGSNDVAGGFMRIPAIFANAHTYGGAMACSIPYLLGTWSQPQKKILRMLAAAGIGAAFIGILLSATRTHFVVGVVIIAVMLFTTRMKTSAWVGLVLLVGLVGWMAATNPRFQRYKSLSDTDYVNDRIAGSLNRSFFEILTEYPLGNGLGGGGTSIPYFLEGQVKNPIGLEDEYARILCEQGIIGLLLWICFLGWFFFRLPVAFAKGRWSNSRRGAWCYAAICMLTAFAGVGLLTAIPQSALLLLGVGWTTTPMAKEAETATEAQAREVHLAAQSRRLAYTG